MAKRTLTRKQSSRQSDVEKNYGGDTRKAGDMKQFDQTGTATRVHITFINGAQELYNSRELGEVAFSGLLISASQRVDSGNLKPTGAVNAEGKLPVNVDPDELRVLINMVFAHRESLPASREDALEQFDLRNRYSAVSTLAFLKGNNNGVDFGEADGLMAQAKAELDKLAFASGADFKAVVKLARQATDSANTTVVKTLTGQLRRIAATIGKQAEIETQIAKATALKNPSATRNALLEDRKTLLALGGKDPEYKPRDNGNGGGNGRFENRPRQNNGPRPRGGDWNRSPSLRRT